MNKWCDFPGFFAANTCIYRGRVLRFSFEKRGLEVIEAVIGDTVRRVVAAIGGGPPMGYVSCCTLGESVLLIGMTLDTNTGSLSPIAAMATVEDGPLRDSGLEFHWLKFEGAGGIPMQMPFLRSVSGTGVLMVLMGFPDLLYIDVQGDTASLRQLAVEGPHPANGFASLPIRLPDGSFLVAGGVGSAGVFVLKPNDRCTGIISSRIADMPGDARFGTTPVLIGERFVAGFGGCSGSSSTDKLWILDLETRKISLVRKEGKWHAPTCMAVLVVKEGVLYIFGGQKNVITHSISLNALSKLIEDDEVRTAFQAHLDVH